MNAAIRQRGSTLLVVMVFLLLVAIASISAIRSSTTNLRATGNMMIRQEALAAAQAAVETTVSTAAFQADPAASAPFARNVTVDVDGDGTNDYTVAVTPATSCTKIRQLLVSEFPKEASTGLPTAAWRRCDPGNSGSAVGSGGNTSGLIESDTPVTAAATGKSFCVETHWNVEASVTDSRTSTVLVLNQGVTVPYSIGEALQRCTRDN